MHVHYIKHISFCSGLTAIATYLLTKELWNDRAGLLAACFIAIGKECLNVYTGM
jgi:asparagine N-glycosylation enzyme membrane subunit Stt3